MMIFESLKRYAGDWSVKNSRKFSDEEINSVTRAVIVPSQFGTSVCFMLKAGGTTYIPTGKDCQKTIGEVVDLKDATLVTLSMNGKDDILRVNFD